MYFSKTTRHALFPFFMRMRGLFSPRVTRARKKRTLTHYLFISDNSTCHMVGSVDGLLRIQLVCLVLKPHLELVKTDLWIMF